MSSQVCGVWSLRDRDILSLKHITKIVPAINSSLSGREYLFKRTFGFPPSSFTHKDLEFLQRLKSASERGKTVSVLNTHAALLRLVKGGYVVDQATDLDLVHYRIRRRSPICVRRLLRPWQLRVPSASTAHRCFKTVFCARPRSLPKTDRDRIVSAQKIMSSHP